MIGKIKSFLRSITSCTCLTHKNEAKTILEEKNTINTDIEINILWEDIVDGIANQKKECVIAKAAKRDGYIDITVSEYDITLADGSIYTPQKFSDHWKGFIGSPKLKPFVIVYNKM